MLQVKTCRSLAESLLLLLAGAYGLSGGALHRRELVAEDLTHVFHFLASGGRVYPPRLASCPIPPDPPKIF